ncbi:MAG: hypothetical protein OEV78_06250 [Spirochaetia bacterium]|nr:hypothetical protein [Spirochaetia bacterium]
MSVRPLDLQVNINSLIETSRDQASRQATTMQEQRVMDGHMIDDAILNQQKVNKTNAPTDNEELQDTERHFGNKTEAETEQQFSEDDKERKTQDKDEKSNASINKKKEKSSDHIIDFLV